MIIKVTFFDNDYSELLEQIGAEWQNAFTLFGVQKQLQIFNSILKQNPCGET